MTSWPRSPPLSPALRGPLFQQLQNRWCIHCGQERERGAAGCQCGRAFDGADDPVAGL